MKSRRSFLALVATAFFCSMSMIPAAHAGGGGGNMLKFLAKQGGKYHSTTMIEIKIVMKEKEANKKREEAGE